ncbi:MAG: RHS repeat-associated core domain-containing protein [Coprobacillaceae bacterium]
MDPIFISNPLANVQSYTKNDSNYTTDYILSDRLLEFDVPYEYIMRVKQNGNTSTLDMRSDALVKYKVKLGDTLRTISAYYGVPVDQIKVDNNLDSDIIQEDDVLLVRMKKDNPKVSKDVYEPPLKTIMYEAVYVDRGPRCYGVCEIIDPVNANTGNYFYESADFTLQDYDELSFLRYYNSLGPVISGMFGNGFTTELESYIAYDEEGDLLFFKGDGKIYKIEVDGDTLTPRVTDRIEVTKDGANIKIYHMDSKETYIFDSFGSLVQIIKETGHTVDITYDEYGMIPEIQLGNKKITFNYNENNLVKEVVMPNGQVTKYEYDENRNLTKFIDASGNEETYNFEDNRMTYLVDKNGNETAKNTYDEEGRVLEQEDANGNISTLKYEDDTTEIVNSDGSIDVYEFNDYYRTLSITQDGKVSTSYTYDDFGNIASKKDSEGKVTNYDYNGYDLTKVEYPDGTYESYEYDNNHNVTYHRDTQGIEKEYQYDGYNLIGTNTSTNNNIVYEYDTQHRVTKETNQFGVTKSYVYDGNHVTTITHSNGLEEYYEYDVNGNLTKESDNQGKNTTYVYNNNNQVTQKNYYDGTNEKWTYDGFGNIIQSQDRLGGVTKYTYDKNHNETKVTKGNLTCTKTYDSMNRVLTETNEQGLTTSYTYDNYGNKVSEIDAYGNETLFTYDSKNRVIKTEDALGNIEESIYEGDNLVKSISKEGLVTEYAYDEFNREIEITSPNGKTETKEYDSLGNVVKQVDVKGNETIYSYDEYGRIIDTTINYTDGLTSTTSQEYDVYDNVVSQNVNGNITTFTFDIYQREVSTTNALGYVTSKEYDLEDRVTKEIDALGNYTTSVYNPNGDIIESTDKNGNVTKTYYDVNGSKTAEEDALEYITTYEYNDKGQVVKEIDSYLHETSYTYDDYGNTIKEEDSEGLVKETVYDEYQRVITSVDAYGRKEEKTYDVRDQVIETINYDGTKTINTYDVEGNLLASVDAFGLETIYSYDELYRQIQVVAGERTTNYVYDANGQVLETNVNESITKNDYDSNGNVIKVTDALNNSSETIYDSKNQVVETIDANGNSTKQEYDAYGNITTTIDALGNETTKEYNVFGQVVKEIDALGFVEEYIFNEQYQIVEFIDKNGNSTTYEYNDSLQLESESAVNGATTYYEYDVYGREVLIEEPNGKETSTTYDALGNVVEEASGDKVTKTTYDKKGNVTNITTNDIVMEKNSYNDVNQLIEQKDGNGNITTYTYDIYNQVIDMNEKGYHYQYEYDVFGNIVKQTDNGIYITKNTYDKKQQLLETTINDRRIVQKEYDPIGNEIVNIENGVRVEIQYDALSRTIKVLLPSTANPTEMIQYQDITYDEVGNVLVEKDGLENSITRTYDAYGNVTSETDGNGNTSYYEYDSVYNMIKVEDVNKRIVEYAYDYSHNVVYKKTNDKLAKYAYDLDSNLTYEENEYGYQNTYEYDVFGNKTSYKKPDGTTISYSYDALGNLTKENDTTYTYDARNNQLSAKNQEGTVTYQYNAFDKMVESKDTNGKVVSYQYDNHLQLTGKSYAGKSIQYGYNENGLLTSVTSDNQTIASYEYNHRNEIVKATQREVISNKEYDIMGRVISQNSTKDGNSIYHVNYTYDGNGNNTKEVMNGREHSYVYNEYDELVESNKYIGDTFVQTTYQYDIYGNQTVSSNQDGSKKYTYNDKNQVTSIDSNEGTVSLSYDSNGNLATKTDVNGKTETYTYNDYNKLVEVDKGQYVYTYAYDGNQERISSTRTDTKDYHYDVWYDYVVDVEVVSEEDMGMAFDKLQDQVDRKQANGDKCESNLTGKYDVTYYKEPEVTKYILDRNEENTTVLASNDEVNIYGEELLQVDNEIQITGLNQSVVASIEGSSIERYYYNDYGYSEEVTSGHGYNGEVKDETGLIYLRARYYDPTTARFIQIDNNYAGEKEEVVTQNRYTYTLNNPYKYVDRDGNAPSNQNARNGKMTKSLAQWLPVTRKQFNRFCDKNKLPGSLVRKMDAQREEYFRKGRIPTYDIVERYFNELKEKEREKHKQQQKQEDNRKKIEDTLKKYEEYLEQKKNGAESPNKVICPMGSGMGTDISGLRSITLQSGDQIRIEMSMDSTNNDVRPGYDSSYKIVYTKIFEYNLNRNYKTTDILDYYGLTADDIVKKAVGAGGVLGGLKEMLLGANAVGPWSIAGVITLASGIYSYASYLETNEKKAEGYRQAHIIDGNGKDCFVLKHKETESASYDATGKKVYTTSSKEMKFYSYTSSNLFTGQTADTLNLTEFKSVFGVGKIIGLYKY